MLEIGRDPDRPEPRLRAFELGLGLGMIILGLLAVFDGAGRVFLQRDGAVERLLSSTSGLSTPATGGSTFTVRAGSASTIAGSCNVRSSCCCTTVPIVSLLRSGEPSGIMTREPSLTRFGTLFWGTTAGA